MSPEKDPVPLGDVKFANLVDDEGLRVNDSLEELSGAAVAKAGTSLIERVARAWKTPLSQLSCEQVRLLLGQGMGLEWLAAPASGSIQTRM